MKKLLTGLFLLSAGTAFATEYVCFASKYPSDMVHTFEDGWATISITGKEITLRSFYKSGETIQKSIEANYKISGTQGGNGATKDMYIGELDYEKSDFPDEPIGRIFLEKSLVDNEIFSKEGFVGKLAFLGHGYSYDWNLCYNKKQKY